MLAVMSKSTMDDCVLISGKLHEVDGYKYVEGKWWKGVSLFA